MAASPEAVAFWAQMAAAPQQVSLPIAERRAAGEHAEDATAEPSGVTYSSQPLGLQVRPTDGEIGARILYLFGGGYMLGSPASRRKTAGHLARSAQAEVWVASYRLAPEHPFPAAFDDATAAFRALPTDLPRFVAGDSSGGGLAAAVGSAEGADGLVLFSPWGDLTCSGDTMAENAAVDIECTRDSLLEMGGWYAGTHDRHDPRISPALAATDSLPPLLAFAGSDEILLDDARRLVTRSVRGDLVVGDGMQHVWPIWVGVFPEAGEAMARAGAWIRDASSGRSSS
ncbi:alpha/beta hydrolase fold domain-containing protein [Microbacterium invictum]|uniref:Alpha/beta hydrolase fold domain-containing protein n=1 Tax=Microbacterium invictum TaxID=515415 RepID=A0ABZ0VFN1_9MICO|nr:alpha/beta hydrolase fold domain-containing protein [Microbacterium invictum]WQB70980.1 alpha/beta hydrolase fold domain-containing protein [Microbacterium invictum]